ncbi:MAG: glycosyltransferase [Actinomycetota bacterium]
MNDRLRYDFEFSWGSTYARAARLIASTCRLGRVLDLGAGVGSLGAAVETFGFSYIGGDLDPANVHAMRERGRSGFSLDLLARDAVDQVVAAIEDGPPIVAIAALDVIEHLPDLDRTMRVLSDVVDRLATAEPPVLVVSIPNVAHYDLAAKLLLGRWDVTEVGLLDSTHITLFDDRRLETTFDGWEELGRSDVVIPDTEQQEPPGLPVFGSTTLSDHLWSIRNRAGEHGSTYQFVRAYRRATAESSAVLAASGVRPFLSVLTRTRGDRASLVETLTTLAAQRDDDFEVRLLVHHLDPAVVAEVEALVDSFTSSFAERVHLHHVGRGGRSAPLNVGLQTARGQYVAVLDDDDVVTSDWVATFKRLAAESPGRIVRAGVVGQWVERRDDEVGFETVSGFEAMYPPTLDVVDTIRSNRSPPSSYAVPLGAIRALDLRYDDSLRVCEDWKFELEALRVCGAVSESTVTSVYRRWVDGGSAAEEARQTWIDDHERVIDDLDAEPTLLPPGSLRRIHRLYERIESLERELGRRGPDDLPHREG